MTNALEGTSFLTQFAEKLPSAELVHILKVQRIVRRLENFFYYNRAVIQELKEHKITDRSLQFLQGHIVRICNISKELGISLRPPFRPEALLLQREDCLKRLAQEAFKGLDSADPLAREKALALLGALAKRGLHLEDALANIDMHLATLHVARILVEQGSDVDSPQFDQLLQLGMQDPEMRSATLFLWRVLADHGRKIRSAEKPTIRQALRDSDRVVRDEVFGLIQTVARRGENLDLFLELLHLEKCGIRLSQRVITLWISLMKFEWLYTHLPTDLRDRLPRLLLVKASKDPSNAVGILVRFLGEKNLELRENAEAILSRFFQNQHGVDLAVERVEVYLQSEDVDRYRLGWHLLAILAEAGNNCLNLRQTQTFVTYGLEDPCLEIRTCTLRLLAATVREATFTVNILKDIALYHLAAPEPILRLYAIKLFHSLLLERDVRFNQILDLTADSLGDEDDQVRAQAIKLFEGYIHLGNIQQILNLVQRNLESESGLVRYDAFRLLGHLASRSFCLQESSAISQKHLTDPESKVREIALELFMIALKNSEEPIEIAQVTESIAVVLRDDHLPIRVKALALLRELVTDFLCCDTAESILSDYLKREIGELPDNELLELLKLGKELVIRDHCIDLVLTLLQRTTKSSIQEVRLHAETLAFYMVINNRKVEQATEALQGALQDSDPYVRTCAKSWALQLMKYDKSAVALQLATSLIDTDIGLAIELFIELLRHREFSAVAAASRAYRIALQHPNLHPTLVDQLLQALLSVKKGVAYTGQHASFSMSTSMDQRTGLSRSFT